MKMKRISYAVYLKKLAFFKGLPANTVYTIRDGIVWRNGVIILKESRYYNITHYSYDYLMCESLVNI